MPPNVVIRSMYPRLIFVLLGRSDGCAWAQIATVPPDGYISGPHDLDYVEQRGTKGQQSMRRIKRKFAFYLSGCPIPPGLCPCR
jgi:hypothetical protein